MTQLGKYLYCIIRCSEERTFEGAAPMGDAKAPLYTSPHDGLAAVVSDSPAQEYDSTRANLLAHERVQERVMREFTLLPVRFGTVASPASHTQDVRNLLVTRRQEFDRLLSDMEGKVELGLKVLWRDEKAIFTEILAENPGIKRLRDSIDGKSAQATHFDRIRLGEMVKQAMDKKRSAEAARILAPLQQIALKTVENLIVVDRMVLNAAFLVDKDREAEFDCVMGKLDEEWGQRVAFKYVGPVPPYNFVNIVVNWQELRG